jgi:hypothetical protein
LVKLIHQLAKPLQSTDVGPSPEEVADEDVSLWFS